MSTHSPDKPKSLGARGSSLWVTATNKFEFSSEDLLILEEAARCADRIEALEGQIADLGIMVVGSQGQDVINPAVPESRQQQIALQRLLRALHLEGRPQKQQATRSRAKSRATKTSVRGRFEVVEDADQVAV